ncbi:MAG: hypothetical protein RJA37_840 [Verrucomicrobiota bacterium]
MTLAQAYAALAAFLLAAGWLVFTDAALLRTFRRSRTASLLLVVSASAWFCWWLLNLPDPDLAGLPRLPAAAGFTVCALATYFYMPDLLAVRSLGVIMMFLARHVLDAGFGRLPDSLLAASLSYGLLVFFGMWWAASPPAFVRLCDWILAESLRRRTAGAALLLSGAACVFSALA